MAYLLVIKEEAHLDIVAAYDYYEEKQQGLGERFLQALIKRYNDLMQHPANYSFISEDPQQILRDVKLEKFPYLIVYEISGNEVIVYAIHNAYQHPKKKLRKK